MHQPNLVVLKYHPHQSLLKLPKSSIHASTVSPQLAPRQTLKTQNLDTPKKPDPRGYHRRRIIFVENDVRKLKIWTLTIKRIRKLERNCISKPWFERWMEHVGRDLPVARDATSLTRSWTRRAQMHPPWTRDNWILRRISRMTRNAARRTWISGIRCDSFERKRRNTFDKDGNPFFFFF